MMQHLEYWGLQIISVISLLQIEQVIFNCWYSEGEAQGII